MLLLLDSTVLISDPWFRRSEWKLFAARPESWSLRILVPWAVREEAVAHRRRAIEAAITEFESGLSALAKHVAPQLDLLESARVDASSQIDNEQVRLNHEFARRRIDILPITGIDHETIIKRAVARRRPCDHKGDGYRDTLNWLSILRLMDDNPDEEEVIWVSGDSDFAATDDKSRLHQDLIDDLKEKGHTDKLRYFSDLKTAHQHVISQYRIDPVLAEWSALQTHVSETVVQKLNHATKPLELNIVDCGLPFGLLKYETALLDSVDLKEPARITNLDDSLTLPFEVAVHAHCRMVLRTLEWTRKVHDDADEPEIIHKDLCVTGYVVIDRAHRLEELTISEVRGVEGDPEVSRNRERLEALNRSYQLLSQKIYSNVSQLASLKVGSLASDLLAKIRPIRLAIDTGSPISLGALGALDVYSDAAASIRPLDADSGAMAAIRALDVYSDAAASIRALDVYSDAAASIRALDVYSDAAASIRPLDADSGAMAAIRALDKSLDGIATRRISDAVADEGSVQGILDSSRNAADDSHDPPSEDSPE